MYLYFVATDDPAINIDRVTDFEEIRLEASRISPWFLETELWKQFS